MVADADALIDTLARRLNAAGMGISRIRISQMIAHPLLRAWSVVWVRGRGARQSVVSHSVFDTPSFKGSPFEAVFLTRQPFRRRLLDLDPVTDHLVLHEIAADGATDYLALPLISGDGTIQAAAFASDQSEGFSDEQVAALTRLVPGIAAALEPAATRRSMLSLLRTYLGQGPAKHVMAGEVRRGELVHMDAAVFLADLRGSTALAATRPAEEVLGTLDRFFQIVVAAVHREGGDVLKFVGDGVLAIFPVGDRNPAAVCNAAYRALTRARFRCEEDLPFVGALHFGKLKYGNIGSADRLDFTVVGTAVNVTRRLEEVAKATDRPFVCSADFADRVRGRRFESLGTHPMKGIAEDQEVFDLTRAVTKPLVGVSA